MSDFLLFLFCYLAAIAQAWYGIHSLRRRDDIGAAVGLVGALVAVCLIAATRWR